jgi:peptidoglycan/xylan/chitin deacetylase (PgdA/CDA1 family)
MPMFRFRVDRTVTLGLAHPAQRIIGRTHSCRIPVLMYHGINNVTGPTHPYFETNTSPAVFADHMRLLHEFGYEPIDLSTAFHMTHSGMCDRKYVVITFDDGFRDFYTHAMPILHSHQFPATMFVVSSFVESRSGSLGGKEFMTWNEVRDIESLGMEIGSHTVSHPHLYSLRTRDVDRELKNSKETIEDRLGKSVRSFSYPYAFPEQDSAFLEQLRRSVESAGYEYGVTTVLGCASKSSNRYFLPRIPANEHDDIKLFQAKLEGAYDTCLS